MYEVISRGCSLSSLGISMKAWLHVLFFFLIWHFLKLNHVQFKYLKRKCCGFFNWFERDFLTSKKCKQHDGAWKSVFPTYSMFLVWKFFYFYRSSHSSSYMHIKSGLSYYSKLVICFWMMNITSSYYRIINKLIAVKKL